MSDTLILGTRKGLIILRENGREWDVVRQAYLGVPISYAFVDSRTGVLWAAADHGHWGCKLYRSADGGRSWDEAPAPQYPEGEVAFRYPGAGDSGQPATVTYIWIIVPGPADKPHRLYVGTEPGGLFQSDDDGETWSLVRGLWDHPTREGHWFGGGRDYPGLCALVIDPRDGDHMYADISVGGVFETADGGQTWAPRNNGLYASFLPDPYAEVGHDPHFLVAAPSDPDVLWQQNHCGVFRTVDGARTWENVSQEEGPANFGFAIAVDEKDANTAWVVPAVSDEQRMAIDGALCVCRTEDGGRTWTDFRQGLPQKHCYDVAYRHALDVRGDRLAFGTTSGNLFLSDDRGESWRPIGNYLPPFYSVRFAELE